jgi:PIN domain nuclease of toxin-antitoxin system
MRLILDTNVLIRALIEPGMLGPDARSVLEDPEHEVFFSVASVWEIAIKFALGRADFKVPPEEIVQSAEASGFVELPVRKPAALKVATLPRLHRDPFDRLLVDDRARTALHDRQGSRRLFGIGRARLAC